MFPDSSYYLQTHLLARVANDYQLDFSELTGRYLPMPTAPAFPMHIPTKPVDAPLAPSAKKPKRRVEWDTLKHCHGTKNNGTRCCSVMFEATEFCRHHQGQKEHPVPLAPVTEVADAQSMAQSFSVHTPAHSRRPSFDADSPPASMDPRAQEVFAEIARDRVGCGHLLKKVKFSSGYQGWSLPQGDDFESEPMFRDIANRAGLLLAIIEGHLTPCGYIEPTEATSSSTVTDLPLQNTPVFATTPTATDNDDDTDDEEADSGPLEMTYDLFESMAEAYGLDDDIENGLDDGPEYHPFGIYITSMEDMSESLKKFQVALREEGHNTAMENIDDIDYLLVYKK